MGSLGGIRQTFRQVDEPLFCQIVRTGERHGMRCGYAHALGEVIEIVTDGQRCRGEDPGFRVGINETVQGRRDIQRGQVQPQAARIDVDPAQAFDSVVEDDRGQAFTEHAEQLIALLDVNGRVGNALDSRAQRREHREQFIDCRPHAIHDLSEFVAAFLAWCGRSQVTDSAYESIELELQLRWPHRQRCRTQLVVQSFKLTAADAVTEELCSQVRDLVGFIENDDIGARQKLDEALLLHRQVRQQQVVIHDNEVRFLRISTRPNHVALLI